MRGLVACGLLLALIYGCAREKQEANPPPPPKVRPAVTLQPGSIYRFTDHHQEASLSGEGLSVSVDGRANITLQGARRPIVPGQQVIRQRFSLPEGARLRLGYGLSPESWNKKGASTRFEVRANGRQLLSQTVARWSGEDAPNLKPVSFALPSGQVEIELTAKKTRPEEPGYYAFWLDPVVSVPHQGEKPNVVIIALDALRADRLGCYGYERGVSPNIDRLARAGALFADVTTQATWTLPSFQNILSSGYWLLHENKFLAGVAKQSTKETLPPLAWSSSLQQQLQQSGYRTFACTGGGFLSPEFGYDTGFDWFWSTAEDADFSGQLAAVRQQLEQEHDAPFFLLLHTYQVQNYFKGTAHGLGLYNRGYFGRLIDRNLLDEAVAGGKPGDFTQAELDYISDLYDGELHYTDHYLGLFVEWVTKQPWGRDAIFVITADHGEGMGEHGSLMHGTAPYQSVARVPLVIYRNGSQWQGKRVAAPVALADITPTLLEIAGAPPIEGAAGVSLLPALKGRTPKNRAILCESAGDALLVRSGDYAYLSYRGSQPEELYDLRRDPKQAHNLAAARPAERSRLAEALAREVMRASAGYRLALAGPRLQPVTITLSSPAPLSQLDIPTASTFEPLTISENEDGIALTFAPGNATQVILFTPGDPASEVTVTADRLHAGKTMVSSITLSQVARTMIRASKPPVPEQMQEWGAWLWITPRAAEAMRHEKAGTRELPDELKGQLKNLGYLR